MFDGVVVIFDSDAGLFVTTVIPLQLRSSVGDVLWNNPAPQSVRYCRPLRIQFIHESPEVILAERAWVQGQMETLQDFVQSTEGLQVPVKFDLHLTVIDGKVASILSGASSQQICPVCGAGPSQFYELNRSFTPRDDSLLQLGISRCMLGSGSSSFVCTWAIETWKGCGYGT